MSPEAQRILNRLEEFRRPASVSQIGGFRPPDDLTTSWFGQAVMKQGESLPLYENKPMAPLLQINVQQLPYTPESFPDCKLLVLYLNTERLPFDRPHGDGWLIREYDSLESLVPISNPPTSLNIKPFPIRWHKIADDAPDWEDSWSLVNMAAVNADAEASDEFFNRFKKYPQTKVGGYPAAIQSAVGLDDFVFQVGSEEKSRWMWVDNGVAYYFKEPGGEWRWSCQFY